MAKKTKNYQKMQMAMFTRSAKMMSYELQTRREEWEVEYLYESRKARRQHRKRFNRMCEYCMHACYNELLVEIESFLQR